MPTGLYCFKGAVKILRSLTLEFFDLDSLPIITPYLHSKIDTVSIFNFACAEISITAVNVVICEKHIVGKQG